MNGAICRQGGYLLFSYFHHRTYIQYRPDIGCHTCFQKSPKSHCLQTPPNTTPLQMNQYHPYHKLYAPYPLPPQKTPICNFLDHPQKNITSKIQPYLKVVECLPFADWDEPSNRNPYEHFTSSAFWYWVSSQYFADCHLAADKRLQLRRQTANKVSDLVNGVVIKERVDRKRGNKAVGSQQWRTQELRTKTDMACSFVQYYYYIEKPRKYYPETSYAKVSFCGEVTSSLEDFQFINSTVISVVNILLRKMEEQSSFNSVVKFMLQNVELDQRSVKVKRSQILCLDELNTAESREQKMQAQQQQFEIKLDFYQIVRNIVYEMPLDVIIGFLQDQIPPYSLPGLDQPEHHLEQLYCDQQDTYNFVGTHSALDDQWIQIKKQQEKERMSREYSIENIDNANKRERKHIKQEDLPCQVCFEGDYEQQNLIMICSLCNIAIHQNCIYVEKVPDNNWICAVCQVFGPAGINLPCPLCPLKGGAMLKTTLRADRFVSHSRHFQKYLSRLSPKQNQSQYVTEQMRARPDIPLLYHYFQEETHPTIEPSFYEVWVHYSCTTLHNEPFFSSIDGQIIVQGVQNIPVQKYGRFCVLCGKSDGVTAKCREEDCNHNYHAECASRIKLVYQQADKENIIYKVFCPQHRPFEVELMLQSRRRKARDQIKKFASRVVKCLGQQKFPHRLPVISEKKQSKTSKKDSMEKSLASQDSKVKKQRSCRFKEQPEVDVASVRLKIKKEVENQMAIRQDLKFFNAVYAELQKKFFGLQNYDMKQIVGHQNSFFETLRLPTAFWKAFETSQRSDAQASQKFNSLMKKNAQFYSKIQYLKKLMKKKVKKTQSQLKRMRKVQPHQLEIEQKKQQKEDNIEPTARSRHQKQQESPLDLEQVERLGRNRNKQRTHVKRYHTPEKKVKKQEQAVKQQQPIIKQHPIIKQQTTIRQQKVKKQKSKKSKKSKKIKKIKKKYINKNQQKKQVMAQQEKKQAVELKKQETNKKIEQKQLPKSQGEKVKKMNGLQAMEQNRFKSRKQQQSNRNLRRVTASNISQVTYCICQQPWNPNSSRPMIECERCREWFHFSCIGMVNRKETETLSFICEICLGVQTKKMRVKYLKSYVQFFKPSSSILRAYHNDFAGDRSGQKKVRQN